MKTAASGKLRPWIGEGEGDTAARRAPALAATQSATWAAAQAATWAAALAATQAAAPADTRAAAPELVVRQVANGI